MTKKGPENLQQTKISIISFVKIDLVIYYVIEVRFGLKFWRVNRRYKEFSSLHSKLRYNFGNIISIPGKTLFKIREYDILESRRIRLERFLKQCFKRGDLFSSEDFLSFLKINKYNPECEVSTLKCGRTHKSGKLGFRDIRFIGQTGYFVAVSGQMKTTGRIFNKVKGISKKKSKPKKVEGLEGEETLVEGGPEAVQDTVKDSQAQGSLGLYKMIVLEGEQEMAEGEAIMQPVEVLNYKSQAICIDYNPDKSNVAVGLDNGEVHIYNVNYSEEETSEPRFKQVFKEKAHSGRVMGVYQQNKTNKLISIGEDKKLKSHGIDNGLLAYESQLSNQKLTLMKVNEETQTALVTDRKGQLYFVDISNVRT